MRRSMITFAAAQTSLCGCFDFAGLPSGDQAAAVDGASAPADAAMPGDGSLPPTSDATVLSQQDLAAPLPPDLALPAQPDLAGALSDLAGADMVKTHWHQVPVGFACSFEKATLYAAGDMGNVLASSDDGKTWVPTAESPPAGTSLEAAAAGPNGLFVVDENGWVSRTTDGGKSWTTENLVPPDPLHGAWEDPVSGDAWVVGNGSLAHHYQ